jgi:hypothetical protein
VIAAPSKTAAKDVTPARDGALMIVVGDAEVAKKALGDLCPVEIRQLEEFG